jgi:hypothetical protein
MTSARTPRTLREVRKPEVACAERGCGLARDNNEKCPLLTGVLLKCRKAKPRRKMI